MGDKRSVSTDALETLGTIIDEKAGRDAIHLAVEPAIAAEKLYPGQDVGFVAGGVGRCDKPLGIVDPFLKAPVQPGQRFWFVVYPRQITSLRHVWTHPAFPENAAVQSVAEKWLRDYAGKVGVTYEDLMYHAKDHAITGDLWNEGGRFEGEYLHDDFWDHYEAVTGGKVASKNRSNFFSCAC